VKLTKTHNQALKSDSVMLAPFAQKYAQKSPTLLRRLAWRYIFKHKLEQHMKLVLSMSLLFLFVNISGCNKSNIQPYKPVKKVFEVVQYNPEYGEVSSEHPAYVQANKECELDVYKDGVVLNGVLVKDRAALNKASTDHMSEYIKNRLNSALDINGAYHGASAAIGIMTGNAVSTYSPRNSVKTYSEYMKEYQGIPLPKEISEINDLQKSYIGCMRNEKMFKPIRTIIKNAETGEVISTFETK